MTNVIQFPNIKKDSPPQTMEELFERVEETRREHVEYVVEDMLPGMMTYLYTEGFDLSDDECIKTTAFFVESFKAALLKCVGLDHSLHEAAEKTIQVEQQNYEAEEVSQET